MFELFTEFRPEIYGGAVILFLLYLRHRFAGNETLAAYISASVKAVADRLERSPEMPEITPDSPLAAKAKLRRKIRKTLAKKARKVNRGK